MRLFPAIILLSVQSVAFAVCPDSTSAATTITMPDSVMAAQPDSLPRQILHLTEEDYREVAEELGVEVAAIKAVVEIEAGRHHKGFHSWGQPLINFDLSMFRQYAKRNGINLSRYSATHREVFSRPNTSKYGSRQAAQQARLKKAMDIDYRTAVQGTFWGMFQIGGFNWKLCGCKSIEDFVHKMSLSEREQLELFARFIKNTGMDKYLRRKNWSAFALRYNGKSYASRGYHTRLASAYRKHNSKK